MGKNRKIVIQFVIILVAFIFAFQLFSLQFTDNDYKAAAESGDMRIVIPPYRGIVTDRNGNKIIQNEPVFDIEVILNDFNMKDTAEFCQLLGIDKATLLERIEQAKKNRFKPSPLVKTLSTEQYAKIQDRLSKYTGIEINARTIRKYEYPYAANIFGYMREVSPRQLERDTTHLYRKGDYIGVNGIEESYEKTLRGRPGVRYIITNKFSVEKGSFKNGEYDTIAQPGENIQSTIDIELQKYGEVLMKNKIGSVVAIEPSTGEVLAFVTAPSYDPNDLASGRPFTKNYQALVEDTLKPLLNRPLMSKYSPGSIFKLVQALIGLEEGVTTPNTTYFCNKNLVGCHNHITPCNLHMAIQHSCNPYFYNIFRDIINQHKSPNKYEDSEIGFDKWREHVTSFGFGVRLGIDLPSENKGFIPENSYYDRYYGDKRWKFSTIYSLSIGQGEIQVTPLQMANLAAILANKGHFYTPHVIRSKEKKLNKTTISPEHFDLVQDAMAEVVTRGTARRAFINDIEVCGKTGTVENAHGEDHSVFIAFAPKDNPKIAIAVFVENSGFGGTWAAPIASLMIEKYIRGEITRDYLEKYILDADFVHKEESQ